MQLRELIEAVKEKNLTKSQLEAYRDDLANLLSLMNLELADIRKQKALYMFDHDSEKDTERKRTWAATQVGQREIELAHYCKATQTILSSLKSRLYQVY